MCGIFGVVDLNGKKGEDFTRFKKALSKFRYRGPDNTGIYQDEKAILGHNLLEITGKGGKQPILSENKEKCLICNGELYEYQGINKLLEKKGHKINSKSDNETLLHLYEDFGGGVFPAINGFYSFALWDLKKEELMLARDNVGKKPLYYTIRDKRIIFSSELKAILYYENKIPEINTPLIRTYLSLGYFPAPHTLFKGIYKLRPGQALIFNKDNVRGFYHFKPTITPSNLLFDDLKKEFNSLFTDSIKKRLSRRAHGFLLSGGIDSSSIIAYASKQEEDLNTYSVSFEDAKHDETNYQEKISKLFSTNHNSIFFKEDDICKLPEYIKFMNEPCADDKFLPLLLLAKKAAKKVRVFISGDGGDELFAGYHYYPEYINKNKFSLEMMKNKYNRGNELSKGNNVLKKILAEYNLESSPLRKIMFLDFKIFMSDSTLATLDSSTMASSIEGRCPYLDKDIVNFSFNIPDKYLINMGITKDFLKKAFKDILPPEIINRKKLGFSFGLSKVHRLLEEEKINDFLNGCNIRGELNKSIKCAIEGNTTAQYNVATLIHWWAALKKYIDD